MIVRRRDRWAGGRRGTARFDAEEGDDPAGVGFPVLVKRLCPGIEEDQACGVHRLPGVLEHIRDESPAETVGGHCVQPAVPHKHGHGRPPSRKSSSPRLPSRRPLSRRVPSSKRDQSRSNCCPAGPLLVSVGTGAAGTPVHGSSGRYRSPPKTVSAQGPRHIVKQPVACRPCELERGLFQVVPRRSDRHQPLVVNLFAGAKGFSGGGPCLQALHRPRALQVPAAKVTGRCAPRWPWRQSYSRAGNP